MRRTLYWEWIRSEAALIASDGCSAVTGLRVECCFEHDLAFRFAKDPRDAYRRWRAEETDYWAAAAPITFAEANARFRQCLQYHSRLGRWSPLSWWRWLGVKYRGRSRWERHRAREAAATAG